MSAPPSLELPAVVRAGRAGPLAALHAAPEGEPRGSAVLVPGFTGSKEDFLPVLPLLAELGWAATSVDLPGQLDSPQPEDPAAYAVEALGRAVGDALDAVGPGHVVGHSFGGLVVRSALLDDPRRARSLVLLGSGPGAIGGQRAVLVSHLRPLLDSAGLEGLWEASEALAAADPRRVPRSAEVTAFLHRRFVSHSPVGLAAMGDALLGEPDRVDALRAAYPGPVLVAHGEGDDAWAPAEQAAMARRLGAGYEVVPDALHSPAAENPEATAAVLDRFWAAADARTAA